MIDRMILLNKKPNKSYIIIIIIASSLIILLSSIFIKTYTITKTIGYITCEDECYLNISLPYNKLNILNKETILEIDKDKYKIDEIEYLNIELPYQNVRIKTNIREEKIVEVKLLNNKQRIIKKIIEATKEG